MLLPFLEDIFEFESGESDFSVVCYNYSLSDYFGDESLLLLFTSLGKVLEEVLLFNADLFALAFDDCVVILIIF